MIKLEANFPTATKAAQASPLPCANQGATSAPETQSSPVPRSTSFEIFTAIKDTIDAQTNLSDADASLVAFWVLSTWFQEALVVLPCLVVVGPAHEATELLRVLYGLCCASLLLAGFRRGDLKDVSRRTLLISEPNLNNQNAALLGSLTNRGFIIVEQRSFLNCHSSKAIYIGDDPTIKRIQHGIYIDVTPARKAEKGIYFKGLGQGVEYLYAQLHKYRESNLVQVHRLQFNPTGVSPETCAIAKALGNCIVDSTALQATLVSFLAALDLQQICERRDTAEALVVEAVLALSSKDRSTLLTRNRHRDQPSSGSAWRAIQT